MPAKIRFDGVTKSFGRGRAAHNVLEDITLEAREREFLCILGPSGCGKSTLLAMAAGLEQPSQGRIEVDGKLVTGPDPSRMVVFQEYGVFPWATVWQNVVLGIRHFTEAKQRAIATHTIDLVGLSGFENTYPGQLSGGMRQRLEVARSLVVSPEILLMDEPLSALDALTRLTVRAEIVRIWKETSTTILFVTHDVDEALQLGDRVALLSGAPAKLIDVVDIDLPRPRDISTAAYERLKAKVSLACGAATTSPKAKLSNHDGEKKPKIVLQGIDQVFGRDGDKLKVLDDINLTIGDGEFVCLLGASGCGKSTLLNIASGLLRPTRGRVSIDGEEIRGPHPRRIFVFQENAIFPWANVEENVRLGIRRLGGEVQQRKIDEALEMVGMTKYRTALPHELSSGMKQRVEVARALAVSPDVLLMDEPFAALDSGTRISLCGELLRIWDQQRITILFVTHDVTEAVNLAERVVVFTARPGRIAEVVPIEIPRPRFDQPEQMAQTKAHLYQLLGVPQSL